MGNCISLFLSSQCRRYKYHYGSWWQKNIKSYTLTLEDGNSSERVNWSGNPSFPLESTTVDLRHYTFKHWITTECFADLIGWSPLWIHLSVSFKWGWQVVYRTRKKKSILHQQDIDYLPWQSWVTQPEPKPSPQAFRASVNFWTFTGEQKVDI